MPMVYRGCRWTWAWVLTKHIPHWTRPATPTPRSTLFSTTCSWWTPRPLSAPGHHSPAQWYASGGWLALGRAHPTINSQIGASWRVFPKASVVSWNLPCEVGVWFTFMIVWLQRRDMQTVWTVLHKDFTKGSGYRCERVMELSLSREVRIAHSRESGYCFIVGLAKASCGAFQYSTERLMLLFIWSLLMIGMVKRR